MSWFVSTGRLPPAPEVEATVARLHARHRADGRGSVSDVYPALAGADPSRFGVSLVSVDGTVWEAGDAHEPFVIMSASKPFVFALVCGALGPDAARAAVGVNATGLPFNAGEAIERSPDGRTNPMVNAGAIATTALVPGATAGSRWAAILDGMSRFAGRPLALDDETYASAMATNVRNRELVRLLDERGLAGDDPGLALDLYTRQCSLLVTAHDLAVMGATLADGGVNPLTRDRVVDEATCHAVLAVMVTAGMYETSGDWLYTVGLPGKSGIGGGIVTVSPGKGGLGTFSPPLDAAGNSVRGTLVARDLAAELGLDLLASRAGADRRGGVGDAGDAVGAGDRS